MMRDRRAQGCRSWVVLLRTANRIVMMTNGGPSTPVGSLPLPVSRNHSKSQLILPTQPHAAHALEREMSVLRDEK
ncbi:uncharacterized protein BKA78DRAFT_189668 [Phyllosticta capitalensis]|uniref:uncharacterized protein n=1 Tax=Phyllosticta capitalensis TaxID=121624 RepID=UPI00312E9509